MGTSSWTLSLSMLALATLASLLAVSSAQVTCEECKIAGANLVARLTGEESIAEQIAVLVGALCPGADDPAGCEDIIAFLQGDDFCGKHPEDPDCAARVDGLMRAAVPVLGAAFIESSTEICQDIAGVC